MADNVISRSQITLLAVPNLSMTISPETILIPINAEGSPIANDGGVVSEFSKTIEIMVYEGDRALIKNDGVIISIPGVEKEDIIGGEVSGESFKYTFEKTSSQIQELDRTGKITVTASYGVTTITKDFYWIKNEPGATGPMGNGIDNIKEYFKATETSDPPESTGSDWKDSINETSYGEDYPYLWKFERTTYTLSNAFDSEVVLVSTHADGIKKTTIEYAISEENIQPKENWSEDYPSDISPGDYLWTRTTTEYLLGDTSVAFSVSRIGIDAESLYTWIKYSNSPDGEDMQDDPSFSDSEGNVFYYEYIGVAYNQTKANESEDAKDYKWSKIKGEIGETGADAIAYSTFASLDQVIIPIEPVQNGDNLQYFPSSNGEVDCIIRALKNDSLLNITNISMSEENHSNVDISYIMKDEELEEDEYIIRFKYSTDTEIFSQNFTFNITTEDEEYSFVKTIQVNAGIPGLDGTSVIIIKNSIDYNRSNDGINPPSLEDKGWLPDSIPPFEENKPYVWTRIIIEYNDGTSTISYSVARDGVEGTGIKSIVNYYILTENTESVPEKTNEGWLRFEGEASGIPTVTETKKCLWNYEEIIYTNGSTISTDIRLISVYGERGYSANLYFLNSSSSVLKKDLKGNITPSSVTYTSWERMGNTISQVQFNGYIVAYAYDAFNEEPIGSWSSEDEATELVVDNIPINTSYIRATLYEKKEETDLVALDIETTEILSDIENFEIGGRNLILETAFPATEAKTYEFSPVVVPNPSSEARSVGNFLHNNKGKSLILSFDVEGTQLANTEAEAKVGVSYSFTFKKEGNEFEWAGHATDNSLATTKQNFPSVNSVYTYTYPASEIEQKIYGHYSCLVTLDESILPEDCEDFFDNPLNYAVSASKVNVLIEGFKEMTVSNLKMEMGTVPTEWSAAPEDLDSLTVTLSNDFATLPAMNDGTVTSYSSCSTKIQAWKGTVNVTDNCVITAWPQLDEIGNELINGNFQMDNSTYQVNSLANDYDTAYIDFVIVYDTISVTKRFIVAKQKTGASAQTEEQGSGSVILLTDEMGQFLAKYNGEVSEDGNTLTTTVKAYYNTIQYRAYIVDGAGNAVENNGTIPTNYEWITARVTNNESTSLEPTITFKVNKSAGSNLTATSGTIPIRVKIDGAANALGKVFIKNYSFIVNKATSVGSDAKRYYLEIDNSVLKINPDTGLPEPNTLKISSYEYSSHPEIYGGNIEVKVSENGNEWIDTENINIQNNTAAITLDSPSVRFIKASLYDENHKLLDSQTVPILKDPVDLVIGGENLLRWTRDFSYSTDMVQIAKWRVPSASIITDDIGFKVLNSNAEETTIAESPWVNLSDDFLNKQYCLSYWIKSDDWEAATQEAAFGANIRLYSTYGDESPISSKSFACIQGNHFVNYQADTNSLVNGKWIKVWVLFSLNENTFGSLENVKYLSVEFYKSPVNEQVVQIKKVKLEVGNTATDWSPSPLDTTYNNISGVNLILESDFFPIENDDPYRTLANQLESGETYALSWARIIYPDQVTVNGLTWEIVDEISGEIKDTGEIPLITGTYDIETDDENHILSITDLLFTMPDNGSSYELRLYAGIKDTPPLTDGVYYRIVFRQIKLEKGYSSTSYLLSNDQILNYLDEANAEAVSLISNNQVQVFNSIQEVYNYVDQQNEQTKVDIRGSYTALEKTVQGLEARTNYVILSQYEQADVDNGVIDNTKKGAYYLRFAIDKVQVADEVSVNMYLDHSDLMFKNNQGDNIAFISGNESKLYIGRAEIMESIRIGNYSNGYLVIDTLSTGIAFTWQNANT